MKKIIASLQSFLFADRAVTIPRLILLIGPMVILLFAVLGVAVQLNRQLSDQQQVTVNRIAHVAVRNSAQLQREHLRLQALLMSNPAQIEPKAILLQRDLVWSRLRILENPLHREHASPVLNALLHDYRVQWEALQPLLDRWLAEQPRDPASAALLTDMRRGELIANELITASQHSFADRMMAWAESSQRLNGLLTGASILVMLMIFLMTYVIYQFFRIQAQIEQGLRNSEHRLRAILETLPDAVFRLTHNGYYIDFKPAKALDIPFAAHHLRSDHISTILPEALASSILTAMQTVFATRKEQLCEGVLYDEKDQLLRDVEARILPSGTAEVQVILRDITTDKQQEEATLQAQKLESLGILAGGIAHDFNNLLTGMLAQASLAKMKLSKGLPAIDNIDRAILSAERAADLTRQLLAYAGKGKFQIVSLDLNQLIRETTGLMQTALPSQATLTLTLDETLPLLEADRGQIQQVVMNLFINAVEALGEEGGTIMMATHFQQVREVGTSHGYLVGNPLPGPYVMLQIVDSGMGMEQTVLSRIFDPFFSTKPKGHGLGLSATMGIIRTHQGALQVQSQPGRGTTFTILLPALAVTAIEAQAIAATPPTVHMPRQTVLVVDDDEAIREVAADILVDHGFTVVTAASGPEGIDQFRRLQTQVGVVLLDMKMPGMNGKQTYQVLRELEPNIKVIFMSGYSETEVTTQLGDGQPLPFLSKPYSAELLTEQVRQLLVTT